MKEAQRKALKGDLMAWVVAHAICLIFIGSAAISSAGASVEKVVVLTLTVGNPLAFALMADDDRPPIWAILAGTMLFGATAIWVVRLLIPPLEEIVGLLIAGVAALAITGITAARARDRFRVWIGKDEPRSETDTPLYT